MSEMYTLSIRLLDNGDGNIATVVQGTHEDISKVLKAYAKKIYQWHVDNFGTENGSFEDFLEEGKLEPGYGKYGSGALSIDWDITEPMGTDKAMDFIKDLKL
jgi:hypothetical protein